MENLSTNIVYGPSLELFMNLQVNRRAKKKFEQNYAPPM